MSATASPVISATRCRRELRQDLALDLVEAQRVLGDVVAVGELVAHQDVHDAERQRGIGADADRQIEVGRLGAARAARIDHDDRHAALLPLLLGERPEMHVGGGEVGAPRDHQVGMDDRSSGSAPPTGPTVMSHAVSQQVSQTVPACRREAPSAWNRPFTRPRFIRP